MSTLQPFPSFFLVSHGTSDSPGTQTDTVFYGGNL